MREIITRIKSNNEYANIVKSTILMPVTQMYKLRLGAHQRSQSQQATGPGSTLRRVHTGNVQVTAHEPLLDAAPEGHISTDQSPQQLPHYQMFLRTSSSMSSENRMPQNLTIFQFHVKY